MPNLLNSIGFYWHCISSKYTPDQQKKSKIAKKMVLAFLHLPSSARWVRFLRHNPTVLQSLDHWPRLLERNFRPYLRNYYSASTRTRYSISHYQLFEKLLPITLREPVLTGQAAVLSIITGKDEKTYATNLRSAANHEKEGDLMLELRSVKENDRLAVVTFSFTQIHGEIVINIGGIQGGERSAAEVGQANTDAIRNATKALHGLRPKQAVMIALQQVAVTLGATQMIATSKRNHIYSSWRSKQIDLAADYDSFWQEQGGTLCAHQDYSLPLQRSVKDLSEVQSKKRAEYARKQALIEQLCADVASSLKIGKFSPRGGLH